jgi:hypothetical protein
MMSSMRARTSLAGCIPLIEPSISGRDRRQQHAEVVMELMRDALQTHWQLLSPGACRWDCEWSACPRPARPGLANVYHADRSGRGSAVSSGAAHHPGKLLNGHVACSRRGWRCGIIAYAQSVAARMMAGWWMAQTRLSEGRILGDGRLSRACVDLWGNTSGMGGYRVQFRGCPCRRLEAAGDAHSPLSLIGRGLGSAMRDWWSALKPPL